MNTFSAARKRSFPMSESFSLAEQQARDEMVRLGASFFQRGYATGSAGNLSVRLEDGNLLATPTGSCLGELQGDRLAKVTPDGEWLSGDKPSKEIAFHRALYLNNPDCKAVVHLHSHYLTALSCLQGLDPENCIRPFTPYVVMRVGDVPVVPYYKPGDQRLAEDLAQLAPRYRAFLLANHGPVVVGKSLREAADNTEELEETARLIFTLGDRAIRYLNDAEVAELRSR
jgi:ribulose-5-phosphate 4-epimerase/fuculose-1-phosphate aldolase